jgi:maltodextrin utilization protein YvdJ
MAKGMNMGIFALLLVITCVLAGVASFFVYLGRRESQFLPVDQLRDTLSENPTNA